MANEPRVSIGLPVFNGELHLSQALDSILAQTFSDFELVVSDNGSTDGTQRICEDYAKRDSRIRYHRSNENRGAAWNYNRVFELSRGEFFKWMAHDDLIAPPYLERCIASLDRAPSSTVLAFPRRLHMTYDGSTMVGTALDTPVGAAVEDPAGNMVPWPHGDDIRDTTFAELLRLPLSWFPMYVFGLIRSSALRKTRLIGPFGGSDVVLVLELRMLGEFAPVGENMFFQRLHPAAGWTMRRNRSEEAAWFQPGRRKSVLPLRVQLYVECLKSIYNAQITLSSKAGRCVDIGDRWLEAARRRLTRRIAANPAS